MLGYVAGEIAARTGFVGGRIGGGRGTSVGGLIVFDPCSIGRAIGVSGFDRHVVSHTLQAVERWDVLVERDDKSLSSEPKTTAADSEYSDSTAEAGGDCGIDIAPVQASRLRR